MFPYESNSGDAEDRLSQRSGGDAPSALESAADVLRRNSKAAETAQGRRRAVLRGRQERDLLLWARERFDRDRLFLKRQLRSSFAEWQDAVTTYGTLWHRFN